MGLACAPFSAALRILRAGRSARSCAPDASERVRSATLGSSEERQQAWVRQQAALLILILDTGTPAGIAPSPPFDAKPRPRPSEARNIAKTLDSRLAFRTANGDEADSSDSGREGKGGMSALGPGPAPRGSGPARDEGRSLARLGRAVRCVQNSTRLRPWSATSSKSTGLLVRDLRIFFTACLLASDVDEFWLTIRAPISGRINRSVPTRLVCLRRRNDDQMRARHAVPQMRGPE